MRLVARIAQSVEQGIENPRVLGSIPSPGTTFRTHSPVPLRHGGCKGDEIVMQIFDIHILSCMMVYVTKMPAACSNRPLATYSKFSINTFTLFCQ